MLRQASDARPASTVTRTGKVASKQLAEAQQVAERGEDTEYGRKAPAADRLVEISEGFREQAGEKMGKAVSITREAFIRRRQKGASKSAQYWKGITAVTETSDLFSKRIAKPNGTPSFHSVHQ